MSTHEAPLPHEAQQVQLVGPIRNEETRQALQSYLYSEGYVNMAKDVMPAEIAHTPEQDTEFSGLVAATKRYMSTELGIAIPRPHTPDRFHILTGEDFKTFRRQMGQEDDHGLEIVGFPLSTGDIILNNQYGDEYITHVGQHEYLHTINAKQYKLVQHEQGSIPVRRRGGLHVEKKFSFMQLDEYVTEKTNLDIKEKEWSKDPVLAHLPPPSKVGHASALEYGDALLDKMAKVTGESPEALFKQLQVATFATGDMKVIRKIQEVVGNEHVRDMAHADLQRLGQLTLQLKQ